MYIKDKEGYVTLHSTGNGFDLEVKEGNEGNVCIKASTVDFDALILTHDEVQALYNFSQLIKLNK